MTATKVLTFQQAKAEAIRFLATEPKAVSVNVICLRASGEFQEITFGPRGGHRVLRRNVSRQEAEAV